MKTQSNNHRVNPLTEKSGTLKLYCRWLGVLTSCLAAISLSAQTFPVPGFTLPPGKTIVITYDVDVNSDACTPGSQPPVNLSNQASVMGTNFTAVSTDDPAFPGASDPTLTPFGAFTIGDRVYNDVDRNNAFNPGDIGINGVVVNLYQDVNNNNMLDAGDGAPFASTTTANLLGGDGGYAFAVCPGVYIVEVAAANFEPGGALYNMGVPLVTSPVSGAGDPDTDLDDNDNNGEPVVGFGVASKAFTVFAEDLKVDFGFKTPTTVAINNITLDEGTNGPGTGFTFTVTRSSTEDDFSLTANSSGGTADSGTDFVAVTNGAVPFTAGGSNTATVTVLVVQDFIVEDDETFELALSGAPYGIVLTDADGLGTIKNDDTAILVMTGGTILVEGDSGTQPYTFTVTLNGPVQDGFQVDYATNDMTASAGSDYADNDGVLTFAGDHLESHSWTVNMNGDEVVELLETFEGAISNVSMTSAVQQAAISFFGSPMSQGIQNDDAALITISDVSMDEGDSGTTSFDFTVTLDKEVDVPVIVNYNTVNGTATISDGDYISNSGTLTFTALGGLNQTQTATVTVNGDTKFEGDETFLLRLNSFNAASRQVSFSPAGGTLAGTGTILEDDVPPILINELDSDTPGTDAAEFVELYDGGAGNVSLDGLVLVFYNGANDLSYRAIDLDGFTTDANGYFLAGNSGVPGVGVTFPDNTLQNGQDAVALYVGDAADFPANTPLTLANLVDAVVYDTNDADDAGLLTLLNPGQPQVNEDIGGNAACHSIQRIPNGSGGLRNTDTFQALPPTPKAANFVPVVSIALNTAAVPEDGAANLIYTLTRTGATTCDLPVTFAVTGTAASGTDYTGIPSSPVAIPAGSASVDIVVNPASDNTVETDETVIVTLADGALYDLGGVSAATGTITNDDTSVLTLNQPAGTTRDEGDSGPTPLTYRVTLSNPVDGGLRVSYQTNDGSATTADGDYQDNDGYLDFAGTSGEFHEFTVNVNGDAKVEPDETIQVELLSLSLVSVDPADVSFAGSPVESTLTNDDSAVLSISPVSQVEGTGAALNLVFMVTLDNDVQGGFQVGFAVNDGTATDADDFDVTAGSPLTFTGTAGESHVITVLADADDKVEDNETFEVVLSGLSQLTADPGDITVSGSPAQGVILNDNSATVTLSAVDADKDEGQTGTTPFTFRATLDNPVQGGFSIAYLTNDGTATTAGLDYAGAGSSLTFTGNSGESHDITVDVNGDYLVEPDETFTVAFGILSGTTAVQLAAIGTDGAPQTGTIRNDETDYGDASGAGYFTTGVNAAAHKAVYGYQLGASIDGDPDGQPTANADGDDADAEGDDEDGVTLPSAFVINTGATVTVNASAPGYITAWFDFNGDGDFADPGEDVLTGEPVVAGDNDFTVNTPASAETGLTSARFRFASTGALPVNGLAGDGEVEDYQVNIVNTQFSIDDPEVEEGDSGTAELTFTISRSNNANDCSVDYSLTGGTAGSGSDYQPLASGTASFAAGGDLTRTVTVLVTGDLTVELDETVEMTLADPANGSILDGEGTGTILNDDQATITVSSPSVAEGDDGATTILTFDISMDHPSDEAVGFGYETQDGTATDENSDGDYESASGSHLLSPGQQMKQVSVTVNGDCAIEADETFALVLSNLSVAGREVVFSGLSPELTAAGTILNDDALPVIDCPDSYTVPVPEGACSAEVTLELPEVSGLCGESNLEFRYRTLDPEGPFTEWADPDENTVEFPVGEYEIEWAVSDGSGTSACSLALTVADNEPPSITCADKDVKLDQEGLAQLEAGDILLSATDNCGIASSVLEPTAFTCDQLGPQPATVTVTDVNGNSVSCTVTVTVRGLPCGWSAGPDGIGCSNGNAAEYDTDSETFTMTASGCYTPSATMDESGFVQYTFCGDGSITAHIAGLTLPGFAGIAMRETADPGAKKVAIVYQGANALARYVRYTNNGPSYPSYINTPGSRWLRIERSGNLFRGYHSFNGVNWTYAFAVTVPMNVCIEVGLIAWGTNQNAVVTASFDHVVITGGGLKTGQGPDPGIQPQLTNPGADEVTVFPNPASDRLYIGFGREISGEIALELHNALGERVLQAVKQPGTEPELDISRIAPGAYYLRIRAEDGREWIRRVVVAERR